MDSAKRPTEGVRAVNPPGEFSGFGVLISILLLFPYTVNYAEEKWMQFRVKLS